MVGNGGDGEPGRTGILRLLGDTDLLRGLPEEDLDALLTIALRKRHGKGERIFGEGAPSRGFFFVVRGAVKLFKLSPAGKEQILHVHGPGEFFAEATLSEGATYPASAEATEAAFLLLFPRAEFQRLVGARPVLAMNMISRLSLRLRQMTALVEDLSLREAPSRLARYLLLLAGEDPEPGDVVRLPMRKGELASLLGTRGETLSRVLRRLTDAGAIGVKGSTVEIREPETLSELAEGENPGI